jgi:hypothetical protein
LAIVSIWQVINSFFIEMITIIKVRFTLSVQDVHEIQTGSDWQDSLNDAVRSCEIFVPLVTPMYGKTQWTNREVGQTYKF